MKKWHYEIETFHCVTFVHNWKIHRSKRSRKIYILQLVCCIQYFHECKQCLYRTTILQGQFWDLILHFVICFITVFLFLLLCEGILSITAARTTYLSDYYLLAVRAAMKVLLLSLQLIRKDRVKMKDTSTKLNTKRLKHV